jgi:hypothetical protein
MTRNRWGMGPVHVLPALSRRCVYWTQYGMCSIRSFIVPRSDQWLSSVLWHLSRRRIVINNNDNTTSCIMPENGIVFYFLSCSFSCVLSTVFFIFNAVLKFSRTVSKAQHNRNGWTWMARTRWRSFWVGIWIADRMWQVILDSEGKKV